MGPRTSFRARDRREDRAPSPAGRAPSLTDRAPSPAGRAPSLTDRAPSPADTPQRVIPCITSEWFGADIDIDELAVARISALAAADYEAAIPELAALLVDAIDGGASINFLAGATTEQTAGWWRARLDAVRSGRMTLFVARDDEDRIVGSTLIDRSTNQNSPHRAEIGKVIVHRSARRQGVARALMEAAEELARDEGRWMLILDTVTGSAAASLYESLGWQTVGTIPGYALDVSGVPEPATYYYKDLR